MTPDQLLAFLLFAVVAAVTPGPSNIILTSTGAAVGVIRGLPCLFGASLGMGSIVFAAGVGLGSLVLGNTLLLTAVKWGGIAFLLWLSWQIATSRHEVTGHGAPVIGFWRAAALQWANPKAWVVSVSAAGAFLQAGAASAIAQAAAFGLPLHPRCPPQRPPLARLRLLHAALAAHRPLLDDLQPSDGGAACRVNRPLHLVMQIPESQELQHLPPAAHPESDPHPQSCPGTLRARTLVARDATPRAPKTVANHREGGPMAIPDLQTLPSVPLPDSLDPPSSVIIERVAAGDRRRPLPGQARRGRHPPGHRRHLQGRSRQDRRRPEVPAPWTRTTGRKPRCGWSTTTAGPASSSCPTTPATVYTIEAFPDRWATWQDEVDKEVRRRAGRRARVAGGRAILAEALPRAERTTVRCWRRAIAAIDGKGTQAATVRLLLAPEVAGRHAARPLPARQDSL